MRSQVTQREPHTLMEIRTLSRFAEEMCVCGGLLECRIQTTIYNVSLCVPQHREVINPGSSEWPSAPRMQNINGVFPQCPDSPSHHQRTAAASEARKKPPNPHFRKASPRKCAIRKAQRLNHDRSEKGFSYTYTSKKKKRRHHDEGPFCSSSFGSFFVFFSSSCTTEGGIV